MKHSDREFGLFFLLGALGFAWWYWQNSQGGISSSLSVGGEISTAVGGASTQILDALASFESVATQHNNPGGMCGGYDSSGNCTGPATFATLEAGTEAALANISSYLANNPAITVEQFVAKWSGATGTVLTNYVNSVANDLQLDPSDPISLAGSAEDDS
jgi:hypothetical protein